jgi:hypothetical protein
MEEVFMTRQNRLSLAAELTAVVFSASLFVAVSANAAAPSLKESLSEQTKSCPVTEASPKLMALPRMLTPSQFCPKADGTAQSLRSCWEGYLRNPEDYRKKLPFCSLPSPLERDVGESEQTSASAVPSDMFHFLTAQSK